MGVMETCISLEIDCDKASELEFAREILEIGEYEITGLDCG